MERREPPPTAEGWFALHDFRTVDWDALREAPGREREAAVGEGRAYLESVEAVEDASEGASATYAVLGHKADLLLVHLRPTLDDLSGLERRLEGTALAGVTDRTHSFVSVTEASGYSEAARGYFEDGEEVDAGLANYIETRLHPTVPDAEYVSFYPMSKRRDPDENWYDLPFEARADHMAAHGDIGRDYGGKVTQMITGAIGLDDWEWGVTLWANDATQFKKLLYEMRFDPSTSRFAEFGSFYTGRRLAPSALDDILAGEPLGESPDSTGTGTTHGHGSGEAESPHGGHDDGHGEADGGPPGTGDPAGDIREELAALDIYAGQPHGEDVYAMVLFSDADADALADEVDGLRSSFEHYDTHVKTAVYESTDGGRRTVVSIWETDRAARTAGGFLSELPDVDSRAGEASGFGTMGMFYTVKPEHREDFVETFEEVGGVLSDMDGHEGTALYANLEDENDMFISSRWRSREDAMAFFRSDAFSETVDWGRDVLADRPRHVFLA